MIKAKLGFFISLFLYYQLSAQTTIGLIQHSSGTLDDGYVLFAPMSSNTSYLINTCGEQVKTWKSTYKPGLSCALLNDGTLLRTGNAANTTFNAGGKGGVIEKIDWNGNVIWQYTLSDELQCQHHDVKALPNGNVLVIAWEAKTKAQAIAAGRDPALVPATLWSDQILEIQPEGLNGGKVVWEWHVWDHLIQDFDVTKPNYGTVKSNPQRLNLNFKASATNSDWIHLNSIDYNESLNQILVSSHSFNEVWIIDHSTTKEQASSHVGGNANVGGDLLYRWGNPIAYSTSGETQFFGQHNAQWIASGLPYENQIMVFNNGNGRPGGNYSTLEIINPPVTGFTYDANKPYLPSSFSWTYNMNNPNEFYAQNISGTQQLANGNVLFCDGPKGVFKEIDAAGKVVWEYVNPVSTSGILPQGSVASANQVFRASFYSSNYPGFAGKTLMPMGTIENTNTVSASCELAVSVSENTLNTSNVQIYPNPTNQFLTIKLNSNLQSSISLKLVDYLGKILLEKQSSDLEKEFTINVANFPKGFYLLEISTKQQGFIEKIIIN